MSFGAHVAHAYATTGIRWEQGAGRIYSRLAESILEHCPLPLAGTRVVDVGAGTGIAGRVARQRGAALVVAVDLAAAMLLADPHRPPALQGDSAALPVRSDSFDIAVAAFSFNHVSDPTAAMAEAVRAVRPGGAVVAGVYAADDHHEVKELVERALTRRGWIPEAWLGWLRSEAAPGLATVERAQSAATGAGLASVRATHVCVRFPELTPEDLVAWRLGVAQHAPFAATLTQGERDALCSEVTTSLTGVAPLERRIVVVQGSVPAERLGHRPTQGLI